MIQFYCGLTTFSCCILFVARACKYDIHFRNLIQTKETTFYKKYFSEIEKFEFDKFWSIILKEPLQVTSGNDTSGHF